MYFRKVLGDEWIAPQIDVSRTYCIEDSLIAK